jgi:cell division protein FtsX
MSGFARLLGWSFRHRRWRNVLNALVMALTVAVVMLFVTVILDLVGYVKRSADRELTRVLILPKMAGSDLPIALYPILKSIEGVQVVERYRSFGGKHPSGARYLIAAEDEVGVELNTDIFPVTPEVLAAWKAAKPTGAIVTETTARELRLSVGQDAEIPTSLGPLQIKVVGISYGGPIGQRIVVHFDYVQEVTKSKGKCRFRVFTKAPDFERVAGAIDERFANSGTPLQAVSAADFAAGWARRASTVPMVLGCLGLFLILTTLLTLANNTVISIRERRVELATLRVLGFRAGTLVWLPICEAMLVGVIGAAIAIAFCKLALGSGIQLTPGDVQLLKPTTVGTTGMLAGVLLALVVPLASALPSALAATRQPLVDALRDNA